MTDPTPQLEAIIALTERVQSAITTGEWSQASELEDERRKALAQFIEQHRASGLEAMSDELTDLQNTHNRLIGELFHHRRRLVREATTVRTGRRAVRAYNDVPGARNP